MGIHVPILSKRMCVHPREKPIASETSRVYSVVNVFCETLEKNVLLYNSGVLQVAHISGESPRASG
jgi:hypothetical protein